MLVNRLFVSNLLSGRRQTSLLASLLMGVMVLNFVGCGESPTQTNTTPASHSTNPDEQPKTDLVADKSLKRKLVGVWLGEAYLDEEALAQKLQTMAPAQQEAVISRARTFLSTVMAIDFRADGTMENDGEVVPNGGQPIRMSTTGQWRVVETQEDKLLVETTEQLPEGGVTTEKQLYRFYPDGKQVALVVPMKDELSACNPLIIFTRQHVPQTNVADQNLNQQVR